jgi:hypothetical protein
MSKSEQLRKAASEFGGEGHLISFLLVADAPTTSANALASKVM